MCISELVGTRLTSYRHLCRRHVASLSKSIEVRKPKVASQKSFIKLKYNDDDVLQHRRTTCTEDGTIHDAYDETESTCVF